MSRQESVQRIFDLKPEKTKLPALVEQHYDFCKWILPKISRFPKDQRYILGRKIEDHCLLILELLVEASLMPRSASGEKQRKLMEINAKLEQVRFFLRLAHDIRMLNDRSYHFAVNVLMINGSSLGSWIKSLHLIEP